jgi:hypothetical protein
MILRFRGPLLTVGVPTIVSNLKTQFCDFGAVNNVAAATTAILRHECFLFPVPCMAISITQSSKIEFADWLGVLAKPVVAELVFDKIRATPH